MGHGIRLFLLKNKFYDELRKDAVVAIVSGKKPQMACHLLQIDYRRNLRSKSLCIKWKVVNSHVEQHLPFGILGDDSRSNQKWKEGN